MEYTFKQITTIGFGAARSGAAEKPQIFRFRDYSARESCETGLEYVRLVRWSEHYVRYYFHIRDRDRLIPDKEGSELSNIAAARHEACASAMDFSIDDLRSGGMIDDRQIEIANEAGAILESVTVRDAILPRRH